MALPGTMLAGPAVADLKRHGSAVRHEPHVEVTVRAEFPSSATPWFMGDVRPTDDMYELVMDSLSNSEAARDLALVGVNCIPWGLGPKLYTEFASPSDLISALMPYLPDGDRRLGAIRSAIVSGRATGIGGSPPGVAFLLEGVQLEALLRHAAHARFVGCAGMNSYSSFRRLGVLRKLL